MKFRINNPAWLQAAGNVGGEIDERFYIKALEDNTEITFNHPNETLMSNNGENYAKATNTTLNKGDKLYVYTNKPISTSDGNVVVFTTSKKFAAGGIVPETSIVFQGNTVVQRMLLSNSDVYDASKVIVLSDGSCSYLFSGCSSLVKAPKLPNTELSDTCYSYLFENCTSLINAPELPATTLATGCYSGMFSGCTSLINAPELPATRLAEECYSEMFSGCTSLTNAPELPAATPATKCYVRMFSGCTSLVMITCLITNYIQASFTNWLYNVPGNGTFVKATGVEWLTSSSGIPSGWTVQEYAG